MALRVVESEIVNASGAPLGAHVQLALPYVGGVHRFIPMIARRHASGHRRRRHILVLAGQLALIFPKSKVRYHRIQPTQALYSPEDAAELERLRDHLVQCFITMHPEGASLSEIADALDMSKSGVEECLNRSLRKIREQAEHDEETREWAFALLARAGERENRTDGWEMRDE